MYATSYYLNCFQFPHGKFQRLTGKKKTLRTLPGKKEVTGTFQDFYALNKMFMPVSQIASFIEGIEFFHDLKRDDKNVVFIDVFTETEVIKDGIQWVDNDTGEVFKQDKTVKKFNTFFWKRLGDLEVHVIQDLEKAIDFLVQQNIVCAFNLKRHHLKVLKDASMNDYRILRVGGEDPFPVLKSSLEVDLRLWVELGYRTDEPFINPFQLARQLGFQGKEVLEDTPLKSVNNLHVAEYLYQNSCTVDLFNYVIGKTRCDPNWLQFQFENNIRRYLLHAIYMENGYFIAQPPVPEPHESHAPFNDARPGFYENYVEYDVEKAYTNLMIQGEHKMYDEDESLLSKFYQEMITLGKEKPSLSRFTKNTANHFIGALNPKKRESLFKKPTIWKSIVSACQEKMQALWNTQPDAVYSRVDNIIISESSPPPSVPGFSFKSERLKWVVVYNKGRRLWLSKDDGKIKKSGFDKARVWYAQVFRDAIEFMDYSLSKSEDPEKDLENPRVIIQDFLEGLEELYKKEPERFVNKPYKKDKEAKIGELALVWKSLPMGFNRVYLNDFPHGYSRKPEDFRLQAYKDKILDLVDEYALSTIGTKPLEVDELAQEA